MGDVWPDGDHGPRLPLPEAHDKAHIVHTCYDSVRRHGDDGPLAAAHTGWVTYALLNGGTWRHAPDHPLPGPLARIPIGHPFDPAVEQLWVKPALLDGLWKPVETVRDTIGVPTFRQLLADMIDEDVPFDSDVINVVHGDHAAWQQEVPLPDPPSSDSELIAAMAGVNGALHDRDPYVLVVLPPRPPDIAAEAIVAWSQQRDLHADYQRHDPPPAP